jgi:predicted negative regulator of RcsB-dependent stress response
MTNANSFVGSARDYVNQSRYTQLSAVLLFVVGLSCIGYYSYSWRSAAKQRESERALFYSFEGYRKARSLEFRPDAQDHLEELWDQVDMDFQNAYDQNKSSSLAPYFIMFKAQALVSQGEVVKGLELMRTVIKDTKNVSFQYLYKTTAALVELDNAKTEKEGLTNLQTLSTDKNNPFTDMALYYLGEFYAAQGDIQKAQAAWDTIIKAEPVKLPDYLTPSPWIALAKMRRGDR